MAGGGGTGRAILSLSLSSSSSFISRSIFSFSRSAFPPRSRHSRVYPGFCRTLCFSTADVANETEGSINTLRHSLLLERLRTRHLKEASKGGSQKQMMPAAAPHQTAAAQKRKKEEGKTVIVASSFEELGLREEVMGALREMGISVPTEIQSIGVPAVLRGENVVLGSHTGSGKTLAYMLPLVQLLRHDEELFGMLIKPRHPRAVVLCPTRELTEQVFRVAKSISHHARFRSTMISGGGCSRPQEDSLNVPIDMVVGTPGRILQHIEDGNIVYGDIKYLVLDEADTMFDKGFGPDIRRFLDPLKNRATRPSDQGFQIVLVAATMTKAVQKLIDEEFQGIIHLRTSTLHKKVASARHDFIKLSGAENKLESLLQVLEPSLAKGNRVMVFCNTLNSSRAVDHFLTENQIYTVNYHGEVPAVERVENLRKFRSDEGDCPTLVCTDLAARGLDLDVDHVIMFDFPSNSIDYLHRTGRTARMGAKGKVTSLIAKKDVLLAEHIEDAIRKNESLESLNQGSVRRDVKASHVGQRGRNSNTTRKNKTSSSNSPVIGRRAALALSQKLSVSKSAGKPVSGGKLASGKSKKTLAPSNPPTSVNKKLSVSKSAGNPASGGKPASRKYKKTLSPLKPPSSPKGAKASVNKKFGAARSAASKLSVVGFRGRSSSGKKEALKG